MKKLRLFAVMLVAVCATLFVNNASAMAPTYTDEEVVEAIHYLNSECPLDMGDGLVLKSVKFDNGDIVMRVYVDVDDDTITLMAAMHEYLEDSLIKELLSDENFAPIISYCKSKKKNFTMVMYNESGKSAKLTFLHTKMR